MVSPSGQAQLVPRGGLRYGPHSVAPENFSRPQSFIPPVGAATSAQVANHHSTVNSHNTTASHEVHVGAVNVHTSPNSDASGIVRDIKPALERASFASLGNYSLAFDRGGTWLKAYYSVTRNLCRLFAARLNTGRHIGLTRRRCPRARSDRFHRKIAAREPTLSGRVIYTLPISGANTALAILRRHRKRRGRGQAEEGGLVGTHFVRQPDVPSIAEAALQGDAIAASLWRAVQSF